MLFVVIPDIVCRSSYFRYYKAYEPTGFRRDRATTERSSSY